MDLPERFFHVTSIDNLSEIAEQGLMPGSEAGRTNFPNYFMDEECVYFYGSVGGAQMYVMEDTQEIGLGNHRILAASNLDPHRLYPDHERLAVLLSQEVYDYRGGYKNRDEPRVGPLLELFFQLGFPEEELDHYHNIPAEETHAMAEYLKVCSTEARLALLEYFLEQGEPVMYRGRVPNHQLEVVSLLSQDLFEVMSETFDELHPELNPWNGEDYDEEKEELKYEAFDEWLSERTAGKKQAPTEEKEFNKIFCDPSELTTTREEKYFIFESLLDLFPDFKPNISEMNQVDPSTSQSTLLDRSRGPEVGANSLSEATLGR